MNHRKPFTIILLTALIFQLSAISLPLPARAGDNDRNAIYHPTAENLRQREAFRDCGFGIFLHFGLYSMLAQGEWYLHRDSLDCHEYAKMAGAFYPAAFDARQWVSDIKSSGAEYLCITSRHHDGFSLWDTKYSDYNIMKKSPFQRDIIKELQLECERQGLRFHIYYSILDWTREDYWPLGRTGHGTGRTGHGNWSTYNQFMLDQLTELVRDYEAQAIWLDGWWDQDENPDFNWHLTEMYEHIHKLNPACLVGNNHHQVPFVGEDFQMFERDVPGENEAGLSGQSISHLPLETCQTMNGMWGYKIIDQNYKSTKTLVQLLVRTAGRDGNLLLNVGPQPDGHLPEVAVSRMHEMGEWMKTYGKTIKHGVRGGLVAPQSWGVTTQRGDTLYVHVLDANPGSTITMPLKRKVRKANDFLTSKKVPFKATKTELTLTLPQQLNTPDHVIEVLLR